MSDWTTKKISNAVEIDLHPDLDSFPAQIRCKSPMSDQLQGVVLNKQELIELKDLLIEYFNYEATKTI